MRLQYAVVLLVFFAGCAGVRGVRLIGHDRPCCEQSACSHGVVPAMEHYSPAPELQPTPNDSGEAPAPPSEKVAPELPEDVSTESQIPLPDPQPVTRTSLRSVFDRLVVR